MPRYGDRAVPLRFGVYPAAPTHLPPPVTFQVDAPLPARALDPLGGAALTPALLRPSFGPGSRSSRIVNEFIGAQATRELLLQHRGSP
jgi:hypothetical protein